MAVVEMANERMSVQEQASLADECAVLEAVVSALAGPGQVPQRLEEALVLIQRRLHAVRARLAEGKSGSGQPGSPAGTMKEEGGKGSLRTGGPVNLVGQSDAMRQVYQEIKRVSPSQATVLLRGESGTGKELVAKAIHLEGERARGPFVRLHCAAVTETLLESELFGHERGAFTGAVETRKGRFELADGGTLFLDEIGDVPLGTQVKLLRVLQDKCFERVGGNRLLSVDVRVISATHRDLEAMVQAGSFREDLYYRLNVVPIVLPPLRDRTGDIPLLIEHFLARFNRENHRQVRLGRDLLMLMARYHWPGNVRELQNCVERLVVMVESSHDLVTLDSVPPSLHGYFSDMRQVTGGQPSQAKHDRAARQSLGESLQEIERKQLMAALEGAGWVQARAARALGLTPRQVAYKLKKYGIREA
ncbi:MAG: sigma 54-interacting transcriptional regulator [Nitrospirae bacterium]|nr:sigma 54-interacting transcriptional regulator [Nitrospirota bacterium]